MTGRRDRGGRRGAARPAHRPSSRRAAAAILAVRAGALDTRDQGRPVAGHRRRRGGRGRHPRRPGAAAAGRCRWCRRKPPASAPPARSPTRFILVDPLDGTREFIAGRDEFTVNLAIVSGGRPVLGIVAAPALGLLWRGAAGRAGRAAAACAGSAGERRAGARPRSAPGRCPSAGLVAAVSRSHLDAAHRGACWRGCRVAERDRERIGAQVLPRRRGRGRRLSAARADLRMGRGGRPRGAGGRRRRGRPRRTGRRCPTAGSPSSFRDSGLHRLGRSVGAATRLGRSK